MTKHYLQLDYASNSMYEYSKTEKPGFELYTSSKGNVSYRKFYKTGVFGALKSVGVFDSNNGGKVLSITLQDKEDRFFISLPLHDQRGNFDNRFIEPLITTLPNMVKEQTYRVYTWMMETETLRNKKGLPYKNYGVSVKIANLDDYTVSTKVERKFTKKNKSEVFDASKHLPELVFEDDFGTYRPTILSQDAVKQFLSKSLKESLVTLGYEKSETTQGTQEVPVQTKTAPAPVATPVASMVNDDDLPF